MNLEQRIGELEDELKRRDERIAELRDERDQERELIKQLREHLEDFSNLQDQWIEAFAMVQDDKGDWGWQEGLMTAYDALLDKHRDLVQKWNKYVGEFNAMVAPRNVGRPIAASETQQADVMKRRKTGQSLRDIAEETSLSLRTVRTIVEKADGTDRATLRRLERIAPDKFAEATEKRRRRLRTDLPRRINQWAKGSTELLRKQGHSLKGRADRSLA